MTSVPEPESSRLAGVAALHDELARLRRSMTTAVSTWINERTESTQSVASLTQYALEYQGIDDLFTSFDELVTDISDQLGSLETESISERIHGLQRKLSNTRVGKVPIGNTLSLVASLIGEYRDVVRTECARAGRPWSIQLEHAVGEEYARANLVLQTILASEARREISQYRDDIQQVAREVGETASTQLSADFRLLASEERRSANLFRALTLGCLGVALAVSLSIFFLDATFDWERQLLKLAAEIPLFLAAYYFSSESRDHRLNATRAREIEVRLNTIRAYTDDMTAEDRNAIRVSMGQAIFRDPHLLGKHQSVADAGTAIANQVTEVLRSRE